MKSSTIQFITRTKLSELARQRESLLGQYQTIADNSTDEDLASLTRLYEGLKNVRVTEIPLHRGLPNIQAMLQSTTAPESLILFWREMLLRELQRGRLRANIVYLFGAFLSEWDSGDAGSQAWQDECRSQQSQMVRAITQSPPKPPLELLNSVLASYCDHHETVSAKIDANLQKSLDQHAACYPQLLQIAENPHHPLHVREEARRLSKDDILGKQFADALRVALRDPRSWTWPESGVSTRAIWTRNKWRLYPTLSFLELTMLHGVSDFWSAAVGECYTCTAALLVRRSRLQHLKDLGAPEVIMMNEKRMLAMEVEKAMAHWYEPIDPWTSQSLLSDESGVNENLDRGVTTTRASWQGELRDSWRMGYGYADGTNPMVRLVHAEIQTLRAAYPDQPLHVVKLDVRDYFASVSHAALRTMVKGLGMTDAGIEFTDRFLDTPYVVDGQSVAACRGVPMEQPYSHWLCEWLMRLMEQFVYERSRVRIIRQIDDICILAATDQEAVAGFEAVCQFLEDVGLQVNSEKCGAVTIAGHKPERLPKTNPRWGVLELTDQGQWQTHQPSFETYLSDARREVAVRHPVLAKVLAYNDQLQFLVSTLGLAMDLGDHHRDSVNRALQDFEGSFFADGRSIFDGLRDCIGERYHDEYGEIPLSWMVWPITAGGLGLRSATVIIGQFKIAYAARTEVRKRAPDERAENWQNENNDWKEFYEDQHVKLEPAPCAESSTMKSLVESFVRRGKVISGGEQQGLSQYWRWTLSIFGPEILEQLGTFEFLLTELVPLQLIQEKLLQADPVEF